MGRVVVVTGSTRGSRIAWNASRFLLRLFGVKARFFHPGKWDEKARFDGLLILGGVDIDPASYGAGPHPAVKRSEPARDAMEWALLERAGERGVPVMGICRGMQLLNLFHGGTLHPHIHDLGLEHPHPHTPLPLKEVVLDPGTRLHATMGVPRLRVNALHHQAVERVGEGLRRAAHDANGLIQAVEGVAEGFVLGLQWHPEFMPYAWHSRKIFAAFAEAVKRGGA
ncbi:gamma-glutamyl-gamma-aminobutyrate hydrolase family protein [Hydrogenimonas sp.]